MEVWLCLHRVAVLTTIYSYMADILITLLTRRVGTLTTQCWPQEERCDLIALPLGGEFGKVFLKCQNHQTMLLYYSSAI